MSQTCEAGIRGRGVGYRIYNYHMQRRRRNTRKLPAIIKHVVPMLIPVLHRKHQQWEHEHQNWTMEQWKKVHWSDESHFLVHPMDGRVRLRRLAVEHMEPGCTMGRRQAGRGSVICALGNVLLAKLGSCHPCGCYLDTYHCCRPCTPFHGNCIPWWLCPLSAE